MRHPSGDLDPAGPVGVDGFVAGIVTALAAQPLVERVALPHATGGDRVLLREVGPVGR
jgi:hypothetical protein